MFAGFILFGSEDDRPFFADFFRDGARKNNGGTSVTRLLTGANYYPKYYLIAFYF
jgi:hypothetical protein